MPKVIILATSRKTRGGVTSVIKAHEQGPQWNEYGCEWIGTHRDGTLLEKVVWLLKGFFQYLVKLPSADLVHIHTSEPPSAFRKRVFFMPWARLFGKKVIIHFHAFAPETTINGKFKYLYKYLFEKADRVIVLSEYWKKEVEKVFPKARLEVIHNPCLKNIANKEVDSHRSTDQVHDKLSILFAGTINQRKGYSDLIKAFSIVLQQAQNPRYYEKWQLVFAGNGDIGHGEELARELGIENKIVWLGWVSGAEKDRAFREATVFCLPSYAEGFPMAVLDAWAYGLPVITTAVGGILDVAKDGENMLLFIPGDVDTLADCLKRMMDDSELRRTIGNASISLSQVEFNLDTINKQLGALYKTVLNE